tara:strand:- start:584 stop:793 length:210 start_codon:yes stop_codon:yes gene_type:complete
MAQEPNAFENQIFDHFRQRAKKINKAIELLVKHNYTIIDLEGEIIKKDTIKLEKKPKVSPIRYNTRNRE